ncbi:hypothetical protein JW824_03580 [bacterium]|nr:hypothetical protein [bacterium]
MTESILNVIKLSTKIHTIIFCAIFLSLVMCGQNNNREISTQPNVISCRYGGLSEQNGRPVIDLVFKNNTGQNIKSVFGGISIVNQNGRIIHRTGFTYSLPFHTGEEKQIPAFAYIDLQDEALNILLTAIDGIPMVFELDEVIFENGQSIRF